LRSERSYSATNYDGSAAKRPKTLRRQFGNCYDDKKVRNKQAEKIAPAVKETPGQKLRREIERSRQQQQQRRSGGMHI
jgi:hypothetical protein